jgi:hypothetical protein
MKLAKQEDAAWLFGALLPGLCLGFGAALVFGLRGFGLAFFVWGAELLWLRLKGPSQ